VGHSFRKILVAAWIHAANIHVEERRAHPVWRRLTTLNCDL
jgi:hypothetical protein